MQPREDLPLHPTVTWRITMEIIFTLNLRLLDKT
jgi:hypothetical protein